MSDPIHRTPRDPEEQQEQGTSQANDEAKGNSGNSQEETRWEVGIFARKVTTSSTTPPDYQDPPGG